MVRIRFSEDELPIVRGEDVWLHSTFKTVRVQK